MYIYVHIHIFTTFMMYSIHNFLTTFLPLLIYYNFIMIFISYGLMVTQLITFVPLNSCSFNTTLKMAAIAAEITLQLRKKNSS